MKFVVPDFFPIVPVAPGPAPGPARVSEYLTLPFYEALRACTACSARAEALQVVGGEGPLDARMLVVGQNPGEEEDREGVPFIGRSGEEFDHWLSVLGLDRTKLVVTNICKCHTTKNRVPRPREVKTCADLWLSEELTALHEVRVILPLGKPAVTALLGKQSPPMTPLMAHHYRIRYGGRELRVFPLPHPAYLLRVHHQRPMFYETILTHVKLTMEAEVPDAYAWTKRG